MKPVRFKLSTVDQALPTGASRFWGNPDLPRGFDYPMYKDFEGDDVPYVFVCQLDLSELAQMDAEGVLPHKGLLSFFAKIDHYTGNYFDTDSIGSAISDTDDVRVFYFEDTRDMEQVVLIDDDDIPMAFHEMKIECTMEESMEDHFVMAEPTYREWETWDHPYEDWQILLQIDSCEGSDFALNFMDCGVLDFLIDPADLAARRFDRVRAIVLST